MDNSQSAHELMLEIIHVRMTFRQTIQQAFKRNNVDMTFEMFQIMHRLWKQQGVSQQYLAEKTAKDKACLTNLINNLKKKHWVKHQEDPSDRRNRLIYLTAEGNALADRVIPIQRDVYTEVSNKINPNHLQSYTNHLNELCEQYRTYGQPTCQLATNSLYTVCRRRAYCWH